MKRIDITQELRIKIIKKYEEYKKKEPWYSGPHSRQWDLLHTYSHASTIREDIYKELCGII